MIKSKKLSKIKNLKHGFFNSKGGKSSGIYKSLNCGPGSKDKISKIRENLKIVRNRINKKAKKIFLVNKINSDKFIFVGNQHKFKKKRVKVHVRSIFLQGLLEFFYIIYFLTMDKRVFQLEQAASLSIVTHYLLL